MMIMLENIELLFWNLLAGIFHGSISCYILLVSAEKYSSLSTKFIKIAKLVRETYIHVAVSEALVYVLQNGWQNIYCSRVGTSVDLHRAKATLLKMVFTVHSCR